MNFKAVNHYGTPAIQHWDGYAFMPVETMDQAERITGILNDDEYLCRYIHWTSDMYDDGKHDHSFYINKGRIELILTGYYA